jgi:hypothetical protein
VEPQIALTVDRLKRHQDLAFALGLEAASILNQHCEVAFTPVLDF